MLTQVSKNKAVLNGRQINIKPVTMETRRAGKFYIRFFVSMTGGVMYSVFDTKGQSFREKHMFLGKLDTFLSTNDKFIERAYSAGRVFERVSFAVDTGFKARTTGAKVFEYNQNTLSLVQHLTTNKDVINSLRLLHGYNDAEIHRKLEDIKFERMMDDIVGY